MATRKNLFNFLKRLVDFIVICFVAFLVSSLVINFQGNFVLVINNISPLAGSYLIGITKSFFEETISSINFYLIFSSLSSLIIILLVKKAKDSLAKKRQLLLLFLAFLFAFYLSANSIGYVPNWCTGVNALGCAFLFSPIVLVASVVGSFLGTLLLTLFQKLYGFKISLFFLVLAIALNIGVAASINEEKLAEAKQILEAGQETISHLGHVYKPDAREYKISYKEHTSLKGGKDICVIDILRACIFAKGKHYFWAEYTGNRFSLHEPIRVYQFEPSNRLEDIAILSDKQKAVVGISGLEDRCKTRLTTLNGINIGLEDQAIYGIIEPDDGKCEDETHFLLVYKKDALIVIEVDFLTNNYWSKPGNREDLLKVAESLR